MKCLRCDGYGRIDIYSGGGFDLNPGNRPSGTVRCSKCKGTGQVPNPVPNPKENEKSKP